MAGQTWAAYGLQCSDMTSLIGNSVAGMVFDAAKALDRVTITVYQSAAGEGILSWLTGSVDRLVTSLGNAIYFPFLAPVVILAAIWLAWQGLIRKRATRTIEGTMWMVVACAAAIWLIGPPGRTSPGWARPCPTASPRRSTWHSPSCPAPAQSNCVPVTSQDPQCQDGQLQLHGRLVDRGQNANELWSGAGLQAVAGWRVRHHRLHVGKGAKPTVVNTYGRQLLWAQAIATNETPTATLITAKQDAYAGIAASLKQNQPGVYSLFQGNQYATRLEIAFAALFAALVAGVLVLLIAITLIILKLGFLLLLVAGPFFLIVGTHPGFGRVVALRWLEMLVGVLLKQAAIALVLSVLLYAYSLIMGTSDAALAVGTQDTDDRPGHGGRLHLPQAVRAPVLGGWLRHGRVPGARRDGTGPRGQRRTAQHRGRGHRRRARASPPTGRLAGRGVIPGQAAGLAAQVAVAGGVGAAAGAAAAGSAAGSGSGYRDRRRAGHRGGRRSGRGRLPVRGGAGQRAGRPGPRPGRGRAWKTARGPPPPLDLPARDGTAQRTAAAGPGRRGGDTASGRAPGAAAPGPGRAAGAAPAAGSGAARPAEWRAAGRGAAPPAAGHRPAALAGRCATPAGRTAAVRGCGAPVRRRGPAARRGRARPVPGRGATLVRRRAVAWCAVPCPQPGP